MKNLLSPVHCLGYHVISCGPRIGEQPCMLRDLSLEFPIDLTLHYQLELIITVPEGTFHLLEFTLSQFSRLIMKVLMAFAS